MKNNSSKVQTEVTPAFAAPISRGPVQADRSELEKSETDKRMLLIRLSDAASRIREEATLIRRAGFTDPSSRLLRILGETIEEQRLALDAQVGTSK